MKKVIVILLLCVILVFSGCIENSVDITECCDSTKITALCRSFRECVHHNDVPIQDFSIDDLVIEIFIEQSTFFVGQTISVRAEIRNETGKDLRLWANTAVKDSNAHIYNSSSVMLLTYPNRLMITDLGVGPPHRENYFYFVQDKIIIINQDFTLKEAGEFNIDASFYFIRALRCNARTLFSVAQKIYIEEVA